MADADLRELEAEAASGDAGASERLAFARRRAGLGWDGEALPEGRGGRLSTADERGVYVWSAASGGGTHQLVHVPAGKVACLECHGLGSSAPDPRFSPVATTRTACRRCSGRGFAEVGELWISRYPVTWGEFLIFCAETKSRKPLYPLWSAGSQPRRRPSQDPQVARLARTQRRTANWLIFEETIRRHPVVNVTMGEAEAFAGWLCGGHYEDDEPPPFGSSRRALRLPWLDELRRSLYGGPEESVCHACNGSGRARTGLDSPKWLPCIHPEAAVRPRLLPWGSGPPSPTSFHADATERCVTTLHPVYGRKSTAPVTKPDFSGCPCRMPASAHATGGRDADCRTASCRPSGEAPAAPDGASPFGVQDGWGNVRCIVRHSSGQTSLVTDYAAWGASWCTEPDGTVQRTEGPFGRSIYDGDSQDDDIGFRVVLTRWAP